MLKFNNKRDVDRHVAQLTKNLSENERSSRGYVISKCYAKVSEHEMARDWLQRYLDIKTEDAAAHKFMGEIYEHLKKPEQAITSYQRSYNLNSKQSDLIKHICRLFLVNDGWTSSLGKAKYWCELADTEKVRDDNVLSLRLKMLNKDKKNGGKPVEEMILKEIAGRPQDVGLRIRLVQFLIEEKRFSEALKYCFDLEMKFMEIFLVSIDWYNTISSVLSYQTATDNWNYWCLLLISIDKKIFLNLKKDLSLQAIKQNNIKDVTNLIFEFDQVLKKATDALLVLAPMKELAEEFINHFRGQMALNIAALIFQKQKVASNDQWRETTKKCLPFLLFAFQCSTVNTEAFWLKNTNETIRNLFNYLKKESSFRCAQAGRTILACKSTGNAEFNIRNYKSWNSIDDIFNQVRETCSDLNWRKNIYRQLFANADQQNKISASYLVQNSFFQEPKYEIISFDDLDNYEITAQHLYASSLEHHVYLGLGRKELQTYKSCTFSKLNLSTANLINCNPETINQIDVDSFLYCSIIQAKRRLEAEKDCYESFSNKPNEKPLILPAANMIETLCSEEQSDWWLAAFKIYKNISGENLAQLRAILQFGIEAVRGIDTPKVDAIILLKLGEVLLARANSSEKNDEKRNFEIRAEYVYKIATRMLKNHESDNMRRIFKFITSNFDVDREVTELLSKAISFLSAVYFKREEFKEFIDDLAGIQNPWAHYFIAEAYRKLDESGKTPKKSQNLYAEKARKNLIQTLALLDNNDTIDMSNPLRLKVEKDLKKLQYNLSSSFNDDHDYHNTSQNGHMDEEIFHNASATSFRTTRDVSSSTNYNEKFSEVENLLKKLSDLVISTKDDVLCVRNDITELKDELLNVRGDIADMNVNRETFATKTLTDVFKAIEELSWNVSYLLNLGPNSAAATAARYPPSPMQAQLNQMYNTAYPMSAFPPMQYPTPSMMQRPPPPLIGQTAAHLQYDPIGQNLMMNSQAANLAMQPNAHKSSLMEALNTPTILNTWNNTYNRPGPPTPPNPVVQQTPQPQIVTPVPIQNKPVEKTPPVNVVITNSDPLPAQNSFVSQPTFSVTIPPQHIKHVPQTVFHPAPTVDGFVGKPYYESHSLPNKEENEYLEEPADYDPRPDFQAIIPLPDEIEVKTGEEDEDLVFSDRCKLFRNVDNEWKERGIGNIKILKNKNGLYRIVMRRDQIHKLCANHTITAELKLKPTSKENSLIWGAEDFSDGAMHLEMFLVRFKTAEQANKFKEAFESAQKMAPKTPLKEKKSNLKAKADPKPKPTTPVFDTPAITTTPFGVLSGSGTTGFGMFSSPKDSKTKDKENVDKSKAPAAPSPFANFSFGQGSANKSFSELFGNISSGKSESPVVPSQVHSTPESTLNKSSHDEEAVEHYEPTAQFEPVIPLPDLIEAKTGEEDEDVKFVHRAKLLRFEDTTKEWKERGIGEMKVLVHKNDPNKARLLMRREQIFKLCCNMVLTKDLKLTKLNATTYSFFGQDYSENEMRTEKLAIKFKTADLVESFVEAVHAAQKQLGSLTANNKQPELKTELPKGFGPCEGTWSCEGCNIVNRGGVLNCVKCDSPRDSTIPKKDAKSIFAPSADAPKFSFGIPAAPVAETKGFGDLFKPKAGSWSCEGCYISNKGDVLYCVACDSPKDSTVPKKEAKSILAPSADAPKFSFGIPAAPVAETKGFGDLFKPTAGSWSCEGCYISNKGDVLYCVACDSPKDSTVPKKEAKSVLAPAADAPKFSFGMPATSGFSFGSTATSTQPSFSFGTSAPIIPAVTAQPSSGFTFGSLEKPKETAADSTTGNGFSFDASKSFSFGMNSSASLEAAKSISFEAPSSGDKPGFNFVFKAKSPSKKSPGKLRNDSINSEGAEEEDEYQEEENQTYFTPVIPLPEKVEIKTGEEDEEILYSHRAKLFRFIEKEWKERGIGDIKILKHRVSGKLRVVMRREQIFKICLNFFLKPDVELKRKEDKTRTFSAVDYSEGELEPTSFAVRFKNPEIAEEFETAWRNALAGLEEGENDQNASLIERLKLPPNFYDYENAPNCTGCIGCNPDDYVFASVKTTEAETDVPLEPPSLKPRCKPRRQSVDKHVTFKLERDSLTQLQGTGNVQEIASVFGGGIRKSEGSTNIFAAYNSENQPAQTTPNSFVTRTSSIFSTSHNTTPAVAAADILFDNESSGWECGGSFDKTSNFPFTYASDEVALGRKKANGTTNSFGSSSIFGTNSSSITPTFSNESTFGSAAASTFSFAEAVKSLEKTQSPPGVPDFLQNSNDSGGFAAIAANASNDQGWSGNNATPPGGFFGLTVKDDIFSKNLKKLNNSEDQNDVQTDENYDPHYEPIISLPDEINVSTGEEEEEKIFGERAKLYRYDTNTKEWKERGVGELKILYHPQHGTHRLLLRREQIFKLVLNQLITADLHMSPMNNSPKAFSWLGLNCAETMTGVPEQLAVKFKNEDLAAAFKKKFDESCEKMESRKELNPEND